MLWRPGRRYLLEALKPARKDSGFGCLQSSFEDQPLVSLSWIRFAAATPSAAAFTISAPPFAQSPPTKTLGWSFGHVSAGEPWPTATITMSHGIVSLPLAVRRFRATW